MPQHIDFLSRYANRNVRVTPYDRHPLGLARFLIDGEVRVADVPSPGHVARNLLTPVARRAGAETVDDVKQALIELRQSMPKPSRVPGIPTSGASEHYRALYYVMYEHTAPTDRLRLDGIQYLRDIVAATAEDLGIIAPASAPVAPAEPPAPRPAPRTAAERKADFLARQAETLRAYVRDTLEVLVEDELAPGATVTKAELVAACVGHPKIGTRKAAQLIAELAPEFGLAERRSSRERFYVYIPAAQPQETPMNPDHLNAIADAASRAADETERLVAATAALLDVQHRALADGDTVGALTAQRDRLAPVTPLRRTA